MRFRAAAAGILLALVLHVFVGWYVAALGAVFAGRLARGSGALVGMATMVLAWGGLLGADLLVASAETHEMMRVTAALLGGFPPVATGVVTMGIGLMLGALGGWLGGTLRKQQEIK